MRSVEWSPVSIRIPSISTRKSFKEFREATTGRFVGIGIEMGMEDGLVKVVSPIEGSPAFRAGMKSGDLITKIDDTLVKGLSVDQAVKRIARRAQHESRADGVPQEREPQLPGHDHPRGDSDPERARESARAGFRLDSGEPVQDRTVEDFAASWEEIYKQEPNFEGLCWTCAMTQAGCSEGAVAVSATFLPSDAVVVSTNGRSRIRSRRQGEFLRLHAPWRRRPDLRHLPSRSSTCR